MSAVLPPVLVRRKPDVELVVKDGIPTESAWHVDAMSQLIGVIESAFVGQEEFYVGGNMFIYYSEEQARNRDFRGPDFFFVWGVNRQPRRQCWVCWEEQRFPHVIIELTSPSTAVEDRTTKFEIYERIFQTPEYFIYDPATHQVEGWRRKRSRYRPLAPNAQGWLWSEELDMWLGSWHGNYINREDTYPRFFDAEGNLVLRFDEKSEAVRRQEAEAAQAKADREAKRADDAEAKLQAALRRIAQLEGQPPAV